MSDCWVLTCPSCTVGFNSFGPLTLADVYQELAYSSVQMRHCYITSHISVIPVIRWRTWQYIRIIPHLVRFGSSCHFALFFSDVPP
eukprot:695667-Pyramimonas_sp.AAC.1